MGHARWPDGSATLSLGHRVALCTHDTRRNTPGGCWLLPTRLRRGCMTRGWKGRLMVTSTCTTPRRHRVCHVWGQTPGTRWLALTMCISVGMAIARMEGLLYAAAQSPQPVVSPSVYVTNARTLSDEALVRLAATLDVPAVALRALLTMLEQRQVPA